MKTYQGNLDAGKDEGRYQAVTKKDEDQHRSGDIRTTEDKNKEEQKRQNKQNRVEAKDRPAFAHKNQLPTKMKAYRCLLTSYVEPLWKTKRRAVTASCNKKGSIAIGRCSPPIERGLS